MTVEAVLSYMSGIASRLRREYDSNPTSLTSSIIATGVVLIVGWKYLSHLNHPMKTRERANQSVNVKSNSGDSKPKANNSDKLLDVFSVKQRPPVTGVSTNTNNVERPFGSSYYYAHNNPNSKGGYTDGLRAEDYVMNGPRLLSKGGVPVAEEPLSSEADGGDELHAVDTDSNQNEEDKKTKIALASRQITRYLWDDDGGDIAKIHIDCLPLSSTETIPWQEAIVSKENVQVRLTGEYNDGLYVSITCRNEKKYHLQVPKMYGCAESVKAIVKTHKLLIKITKRKISRRQSTHSNQGMWSNITWTFGMLFGDGHSTENYMSVKWPQLTASGGDIDEKLFKEVDFRE
eukprot:CCRYP_019817-RA/>CCRYP_019817-RA protein AED:0.20 eAED:0.20 QI:214/-1/1/1/-1/1/1/195/345